MPVPESLRRYPWGSALAIAIGALGAWWAPAASSMPDTVPIPILEPRPGGVPTGAVFRHHSHRQYVCYACHPTLFPRSRVGFTHAQMRQGRYCGACHDGGVAFSTQTGPCESCHETP